MDDINIIGDGTFEICMKNVNEVLERLVDKGLQINPDKSSWAKDQVEYLDFLFNRDGVEPQPMKIQGILDMDTPETQRHVREFIVMVNFNKKIFGQTIGNTNTAHQSHWERNKIRMGRGTGQSIQRNEAINGQISHVIIYKFRLTFRVLHRCQ